MLRRGWELSSCPFCGRKKPKDKKYCEYCEYTLCEICGNSLARGYCAVCGRLVCDNDSKMVGFARVCRECLAKNPNYGDYEYLKNFFRKLALLSPIGKRKITKISSHGSLQGFGKEVYLHIGLDDADSPYGMCTTYLGALLFKELSRFSTPMDYPLLIRLNPNIPMKTRGNAAVALRFRIPKNKLGEAVETVLRIVHEYVHTFFKKTKPGIIIYVTREYKIDKPLYEIYLNALRDIVPVSLVREIINELKYGYLEIYSETEEERGIIGGLAAVGAVLDDYTFELLVYRSPENISKEREIDADSVIQMNEKYSASTFDNIDRSRILIAPKGPDPVLLGIRGDFPDKLVEAFKMLKHEKFELWAIFRSNQGTQSHVINIEKPEDAKPYQTISITARVHKVYSSETKVFILAKSGDWEIESTIYKIQKELQRNALKLSPRDTIRLIGTVIERRPNYLKLNLEEFITLKLVPTFKEKNPICPNCGTRLKKKGRELYICEKCRTKYRFSHKLIILYEREEIKERKRYESPPRAHRHLTLPTKRLFYRAWKLHNLLNPYLIHPIVGESKNISLKIVKSIKKLEIFQS